MKSILFLGDAHLRDDDPEVDVFLQFLRETPSRAAALYLMGDLFDLWVGSPAFLTDCHHRVLEALRRLRAAGVDLVYVEGNRDYRLGRLFESDPFRSVVRDGTEIAFAGRRIHLAHGDLVNREDRQYRFWRRVAKGPLLLGAFEALPAGAARSLARRLERDMAKTNMRQRSRFPEEECRRFAMELRGQGADMLVLGHFHQEKRLSFSGPSGSIDVFVLPAWRESHRLLSLREDGAVGFEAIGGGG
jgi:UDP-2,3-diacylglucosamine hydrolase